MEKIDATFQTFYRPLCLYAIHYLQDVDEAEDISPSPCPRASNGNLNHFHGAYRPIDPCLPFYRSLFVAL